MSAVTASPAADTAPADRRRQRVTVPWRLVSSADYEDVALAVYLKVAALGQREAGCTAAVDVLAGYLGTSPSSVERGLRQLARPSSDGVVELSSRRRSRPGGRGETAVRRPRPLSAGERFVWLPVAAAEDLTPRQLRAYAVIAYAVARGIPVTEGELAGFLRHHRGARAGQPVTVTAAGQVVDALEASGWVTVQRREAERGRHAFVAHDIPPAARGAGASSGCSQPGDGSGSPADDGSLAYKEDHWTDSPDDAPHVPPPAVGEVQDLPAGTVENPPHTEPDKSREPGLALRADEDPHTTSPNSTGYTGPPLTINARIWHVLEPVHHLMHQITNVWLQRRIAREVGRQLRDDTDDARLRHRLQQRRAAADEIRDPGRWILGVALPRWGCGHQQCETGILWHTGHACPVCAEVRDDRRTAGLRHWRTDQGLCPHHGLPPAATGTCPDCQIDALTTPAPPPARTTPPITPAAAAAVPAPAAPAPRTPVDPTPGRQLQEEIARRRQRRLPVPRKSRRGRVTRC